ncbi:hypothetical protein HDU81_000282 [Chytriomyces hyalinus]|nr:hypothetical protein HDU81_000282 [Chytriomyces hyalinus]
MRIVIWLQLLALVAAQLAPRAHKAAATKHNNAPSKVHAKTTAKPVHVKVTTAPKSITKEAHKPVKSVKPVKPEKPVKPVKPEKPGKPVKPGKPSKHTKEPKPTKTKGHGPKPGKTTKEAHTIITSETPETADDASTSFTTSANVTESASSSESDITQNAAVKSTTAKTKKPLKTRKSTSIATASLQNNADIGDTTTTLDSMSSSTTTTTTTADMTTSPSPSPTIPPCTSYSIRREWRDLSTTQKQTYIDALATLRKKESLYNQPSRYHDFGYIHARYVELAHGLPIFLPWHREFLRQFEEEMQLINPTISVPYWDWGFNADKPLTNTDMFSSGLLSFGTRGYANPPCVVDGFCGNWTDRDNQCLTRAYNPTGLAFTDDVDLAPAVFAGPDFDSVSITIESAHNQVHDYIGGSNYPNRSGDMFPVDRSTNDPIFFLHHANVDRLWWSWQQNKPVEGKKYSTHASINDVLPGLTYKNQKVDVKSTLDSMGGAQWCIVYAPHSKGLPLTRSSLNVGLSAFNSFSQVKGTGSNKQLVKHAPKPVSQNWIKTNAQRLNKNSKKMETQIRTNEKYMAKITSQFEKEMNAFFKYNPQSNFAEAFQYTIDNWDWSPIKKAVP